MMKNKVKLKKFLINVCLITVIITAISAIISILQYRTYTKNYNNKISSIVKTLEEKYPDISADDIIEIINQKDRKTDIFKKYSIDTKKDSIILENEKEFTKFMIINVLWTVSITSILTALFLIFNKNKDKEIKEITKYIEEINRKNYSLHIDEISEDELSILKNEIYKTTIMLKEQAENSNKEKLELKEALSDISHQIKTPLTSISIILDNMIEDTEMDSKTRNDFIFDIKREINNINFLVQSLLKLVKLETNTVEFRIQKINLKELVEASINKISALADLKKVKIKMRSEKELFVDGDINWQVEAISNIIKNCIEYSKENDSVDIEISGNKVYSQILIKDNGIGIEQEELSHIFERFYKGKNASENSVGIGLALAKTIIEKNNGKIIVESEKNKGTIFTIKYYR